MAARTRSCTGSIDTGAEYVHEPVGLHRTTIYELLMHDPALLRMELRVVADNHSGLLPSLTMFVKETTAKTGCYFTLNTPGSSSLRPSRAITIVRAGLSSFLYDTLWKRRGFYDGLELSVGGRRKVLSLNRQKK
ncbi:hypothetical protein FS842_010193 [Serendipita sp. 407]|nr:hypothetical protein FS842_010193 [Serendipita sp. 407]